MITIEELFIKSAIKRFGNYKDIADKAMEQLNPEDLYYIPSEDSNSIAMIIRHMYGNMMSRWTDFLTTDGEKPTRMRDSEFEETNESYQILLQKWQDAWKLLFTTLQSLKPEDLLKSITIRNEPLTVLDAINRQLAHYPYHVGQIVYIAKMIKKQSFKSLSIPKKR